MSLKENFKKIVGALKNLKVSDGTDEMEKTEKKGLRAIWIVDFIILGILTVWVGTVVTLLSLKINHYFTSPHWAHVVVTLALVQVGLIVWWKMIVVFLTNKKWRMVGQIPPVHYGVPILFGKVLPFTASAGPAPRIPGILDWWIVDEGIRVTNKEIPVNAKPPNRQEIIVPVTVEWRADRRLVFSNQYLCNTSSGVFISRPI